MPSVIFLVLACVCQAIWARRHAQRLVPSLRSGGPPALIADMLVACSYVGRTGPPT